MTKDPAQPPIPFIRLAGFVLSLLLPGIVALSEPGLAVNAVYKYVDDQGITNFTEDVQQVPAAYLGRVQTLDPLTLQPIQAVSPSPNTPRTKPNTTQTPPPAPQTAPSQPTIPWLGRLDALSMGSPSRYQLAVGLTTLVLILGAWRFSRISQNPVTRLFLKLSIMLMIGGAAYAFYQSNLNDRIVGITGQPHGSTTTEQNLSQGLSKDTQGTTGRLQQTLDAATAPAQAILDATVTATVGKSRETVEGAQRAAQQQDQALRAIESAP